MPSTTDAKPRPVAFSPESVRAIRAGLKTQSRRVIVPQPPAAAREAGDWFRPREVPARNAAPEGLYYRTDHGMYYGGRCPYGPPGTRLYVKESYALGHLDGRELAEATLTGEGRPIFYRADWPDPDVQPSLYGAWKSPRFMPMSHARLWLVNEGTRVERLQDISLADCLAEGLVSQEGGGTGAGSGYKWHGTGYHGGSYNSLGLPTYHTPRSESDLRCTCAVGMGSAALCAFREVWDRLNAARGYGWVSNPWVRTISFRELTHESE